MSNPGATLSLISIMVPVPRVLMRALPCRAYSCTARRRSTGSGISVAMPICMVVIRFPPSVSLEAVRRFIGQPATREARGNSLCASR